MSLIGLVCVNAKLGSTTAVPGAIITVILKPGEHNIETHTLSDRERRNFLPVEIEDETLESDMIAKGEHSRPYPYAAYQNVVDPEDNYIERKMISIKGSKSIDLKKFTDVELASFRDRSRVNSIVKESDINKRTEPVKEVIDGDS